MKTTEFVLTAVVIFVLTILIFIACALAKIDNDLRGGSIKDD